MVFSTVPAQVVDRAVLERLPTGASSSTSRLRPITPTSTLAAELGHRAVWARGLGRRAPVTVGAEPVDRAPPVHRGDRAAAAPRRRTGLGSADERALANARRRDRRRRFGGADGRARARPSRRSAGGPRARRGTSCPAVPPGAPDCSLPRTALRSPRPGAVREGLRHMLTKDSPFSMRPRPGLVPWLVRFMLAARPERVRAGTELIRELQLREPRAPQGARGGGSRHRAAIARGDQRLRDGAGVRRRAVGGGGARRARDQVAGADAGGGAGARARAVRRRRGGRLLPGRGAVRARAIHARGGGGGAWPRAPRSARAPRCFDLRTSGGPGGQRSTRRSGEVRPREVVVANGAWTAELSAQPGADPAVEGGKGYHVDLARGRAPIHRFPSTCRRPASSRRRSRTGSGSPERCSSPGSTCGWTGFGSARRWTPAIRTLRGIDAGRVTEVWRGIRPCTPDGLPGHRPVRAARRTWCSPPVTP